MAARFFFLQDVVTIENSGSFPSHDLSPLTPVGSLCPLLSSNLPGASSCQQAGRQMSYLQPPHIWAALKKSAPAGQSPQIHMSQIQTWGDCRSLGMTGGWGGRGEESEPRKDSRKVSCCTVSAYLSTLPPSSPCTTFSEKANEPRPS